MWVKPIVEEVMFSVRNHLHNRGDFSLEQPGPFSGSFLDSTQISPSDPCDLFRLYRYEDSENLTYYNVYLLIIVIIYCINQLWTTHTAIYSNGAIHKLGHCHEVYINFTATPQFL